MSYGRYLEEFTVGDVYKHWPGRTITEHDDTWFSLMTMNQNPLHIDEHYAAGMQHGHAGAGACATRRAVEDPGERRGT